MTVEMLDVRPIDATRFRPSLSAVVIGAVLCAAPALWLATHLRPFGPGAPEHSTAPSKTSRVISRQSDDDSTNPNAAVQCSANPSWLEQPNLNALFNAPAPLRHDQNNGPDCPFYQAAWQVFLYATHPAKAPDGSTVPRFLVSPEFFTIEQTFGESKSSNFPSKEARWTLSLAVKSLQRANSSNPSSDPAIAAGVAQAGSLSPAVDQNGNPLYYAIHFNKVIKEFFAQPDPQKPNLRLLTVNDLKAAQQDPGFKNLEFPAGSIEIKSAWQIVSDAKPPAGCFTARAGVPTLKVQTDDHGKARLVDSGKPPTTRTVALIGIHIVFALKGHPEFIWSTFEHVDANANPDTAPSAAQNPTIPPGPTQYLPSPVANFLLFKTGTQFAAANQVVTPADILANFDEGTQSFTKTGTPFQTSIYRVYRASKADNKQQIDDEVQAVNDSMTRIFNGPAFNPRSDQRNRYRLVGAVWMDNPGGLDNHPDKQFLPGKYIRNALNQSPDDPAAKVAGEDRLSGTALESFTQFDPVLSPNHSGQPNCFFCHDSHSIPDDNNQNRTLIIGSKLNVSHILSRYLVVAPSPVPP
jgi:hypothetical protein